jgi:hypothetical protein
MHFCKCVCLRQGRFVAPSLRRLVAGFLQRRPGFEAGSAHVGFVVDIVALTVCFFRVLQFPCQSIDRMLHIHLKSCGAGTTGPILVDVASALSLTPLSKETHYKLHG